MQKIPALLTDRPGNNAVKPEFSQERRFAEEGAAILEKGRPVAFFQGVFRDSLDDLATVDARRFNQQEDSFSGSTLPFHDCLRSTGQIDYEKESIEQEKKNHIR